MLACWLLEVRENSTHRRSHEDAPLGRKDLARPSLLQAAFTTFLGPQNT
jgi:hypothetical protein